MICDLSPQVTGNWSVDHAIQISLNYECSKIMDKVLMHKGNAIFKVFDGEYSMEFRDYIKKKFARINLTKPEASRKQSSELYYVCLGFTGWSEKILIISFMFAFVLKPVGQNDVGLAKYPFFCKFFIASSNFGGDDFIFDAISSSVK